MCKRAAIVAGLVAMLAAGLTGILRAAPQRGVILVCKVEKDAITPVTAEFIIESLHAAQEQDAALFVLRLDTPGGLEVAMRDIIQAFLASEIPTAVYVAPSGAQAASAGFMIALSADVVVMASGTNMGAATPVAIGGEMDETMHAKVVQNAAAYARSIAERRGRPVDVAVEAITEARSFAASEALELGLADAIADDMEELIDALSGRVVRATEERPLTLDLDDAAIEELEMSLRQRILSTIANPQIAYFLLLLGAGGLYFELSNPGAVLPGVVGAVSLVLALLAFQQLPFSYAGLMLLVLGVVFIILELNVISYGLLTLAGLISFVLGSMLLFTGPIPEMRLSPMFVLPMAFVFVALMALMVHLAVAAQRSRVLTGRAGLLSEIGEATGDFGPDGRGQVFVHGELWRAHAEAPIRRGDAVEIVDAGSGLRVEVRPVSGSQGSEPGTETRS